MTVMGRSASVCCQRRVEKPKESNSSGSPYFFRSICYHDLPIALRPRDSSNSINSRYASRAPDRRLPISSGNLTSGKKPAITSFADFELSAGVEQKKPVITEVAAFARDFGPQLPGERTTIPANLR